MRCSAVSESGRYDVMRLRRHFVAFIAVTAVTAALVVTQAQPVAATPTTEGAEVPEFERGVSPEVVTLPFLSVDQSTGPQHPQDFTFTGCMGTTGTACDTFQLDDDDTDATLPGSLTGQGLVPGIYVVTQAPTANWSLTGISCSNTTTEVVDLAKRQVTVDLQDGQGVFCTFSNRSQSIRITQNTEPNDPQDFAFTGCDAASNCTTFTLDDDTDPTHSFRMEGDTLPTGTYTLTQAPDAAWDLTQLTCHGNEVIDLAQRRVTITLDPGDTANCTFTNRTQSITLIQDTTPDGGQDFGFTGCLGSGCSTLALDDDADPALPRSVMSRGLVPGTYTITQDDVPGHELTNISCPGETVDLGARRATITLGARDDVTCTFSNRPIPPPLTDVAEITTGLAHTCARLTDGQARCWGDKVLGNGAFDAWPTPRVVVAPDGSGPLTDVVDIAAGNYHTCAALGDGRAVCWGTNAAGELGDGTTSGTEVAVRPVYVSNPEGTGHLTGVTSVSAGWYRSCAVLTTGEARCWGNGASGALGDGQFSARSLPVTVLDSDGLSPLDDVTQIVTGLQHSCALLEDGQVRCWGDNTSGTVGDGTFQSRLAPTPVSNEGGTGPLVGVTEISTTWRHTCARTNDSQAVCWGNVPPSSSSSARPVVVSNAEGTGPFEGVASVAAGDLHSCLITSSGGSACWGSGPSGQLGHGPTHLAQSPRPVAVLVAPGMPLEGAAQVTAGYSGSCVVLTNAEARCWGRGGKTGDGTALDRPYAVTVLGPTG